MPELSRFFGISILMYFNDRDPPHFHARYNEHRAIVRIGDLDLIDGALPQRVMGLVLEWAQLHRTELAANWQSLRKSGSFEKIEPLV